MIYISTFLIAFLSYSQVYGHQDLTPLAATCSPSTTVQVFSSIFFIDLISSHDPELVFGSNWPSDIAAYKLYREKLRIFLDKVGLANAEHLASSSARAVSSMDEYAISSSFLNAGFTAGTFLAERGLLSCDNVIQRATELFVNEQRAFRSLDPAELGSYAGAIVAGLADLFEDLGYTREENEVNWQRISDIFYRDYNK